MPFQRIYGPRLLRLTSSKVLFMTIDEAQVNNHPYCHHKIRHIIMRAESLKFPTKTSLTDLFFEIQSSSAPMNEPCGLIAGPMVLQPKLLSILRLRPSLY
jgi:hypothetical protein